ncbi:MAG: hypothetical protein M1827_003807 [Pycnora praestabilis]|nr:MAG: hypothetical protein M1827_003807 [Pycnora praestabilis]
MNREKATVELRKLIKVWRSQFREGHSKSVITVAQKQELLPEPWIEENGFSRSKQKA